MGIDINTLAAAKNYVDETLVGAGGLKGEDGFSPVVAVKESSDTVYKLEITTAAAKFETPNLMASVTVEDTLSADSANPVQNKAIVAALANKANTVDIPTSLPANGGNADTVGGLHANEIAINPNLLINPDFRVNQRGLIEYTGAWIYSVDRWQSFSCKVIPVSDGINLSLTGADYFSILQKFENTLPFGQYTISWSIDNHIYTGTGLLDENGFTIYFDQSRIELHSNYLQFYMISVTDITINWVKLELGSIATPFVPPDPATELVKCQRYYFATKDTGDQITDDYIVGTSADIRWIPLGYLLPTKMRTVPTVNISSIFKWGKVGNNEVDTIQPTCQCSNWCIRNIESSTDSFVADTQYYIRFTADAEIY